MWAQIRDALRTAVGTERFDRWLDHLALLAIDDQRVTIGTPNRFVLEWIESRYLAEIEKAVAVAVGPCARVELSISGALFRRQRDARPAAAAPAREPRHAPAAARLETFVPGSVNGAAYRAVVQVLREDALQFNPLLIFGGSGTGKTHLLQGLSAAYERTHASARVRFTTGDEFAAAFRQGLRQREIKKFRGYYRSLDLLAVDDLQQVCGKRQTQEEFLHTFDTLVNRGCRVVIGSTAHPADIEAMPARLRQRLLAGLVVRLRQPDVRTRLAIARGENDRLRRLLSDDVVGFLARHAGANVRELIGAVTRLGAYTTLEGRTISVEEARVLLVDQVDGTRANDLTGRVLDAVSELAGLRREELTGDTRRRRVVFGRKLAMYLLRTHAGLSLRETGRALGGRTAPTVRSAVSDVREALGTNGETGPVVERLERMLGLRD